MAASTTAVDAVAVEVLRNGLGAIADEMAATHVRAAYSSVVRDMLDFSTAVCDGDGRVVAQGLSLALQLGAIPRFMQHVMDLLPAPPEPGDVYALNHPWQGGVHLPDFFFGKPVFMEGEPEPLAWAVIVSHMVDVGGPTPGGIAVSSRSLWDEGLVLPFVRLVRCGETDQGLLDVIAANTRHPDKVLGDIRAVLAGLETGARQVRDLASRTGTAPFRTLTTQLLDTTEVATRRAIRALPDGTGEAVDHLDDDGSGGPPLEFRCRVVKEGDRLSFDFAGTAKQVHAGINCTIADTLSVVSFVARAALGDDLPVNEGFTRCLDYSAPEGCIVNATYPAALGSRAASIYRLTDVAMGALASLVPERIPANDGGPAVVYLSGTGLDGNDFILLDYVQAGWGATAMTDGVAGVSHPISNAGNIPVEIAEQDAPIRIREFGLGADTSGAGRHVGAPAVVREYEALVDGVNFNYRLERCRYTPSGALGGGAGSNSVVEVRRVGGNWESLPGKGQVLLAAGDHFRIRLASGGGFGPPEERDPELLARDVERGLTSERRAREDFGATAVTALERSGRA